VQKSIHIAARDLRTERDCSALLGNDEHEIRELRFQAWDNWEIGLTVAAYPAHNTRASDMR